MEEITVVRVGAKSEVSRELENSIMDALVAASSAGDTEVVGGLTRAWKALFAHRSAASVDDRSGCARNTYRAVASSPGTWVIDWSIDNIFIGHAFGLFNNEADASLHARELSKMDC